MSVKLILRLLIFATIISCKVKKYDVNVPWLIQVEFDGDIPYRSTIQDSIKKYETLKVKNVNNRSNYYAFLANLIFLDNPTSKKIPELITWSFEADSVQFCQNIIKPCYSYLIKDNPKRNYEPPFLIEHDFSLLLGYLDRCQSCCVDSASFEKLKKVQNKNYYLSLQWLSLNDQKYRIPGRETKRYLQVEIDSLNQLALDSLLLKYGEPNEEVFRSTIYVSILHSEDCEWTKKWLKIYMDNYHDTRFFDKHMNHFLYRSTCSNEYFRNLIENYEPPAN